jgi:hypothetical protein
MTQSSRNVLEVLVTQRDGSWEWQVRSGDTVLVSGSERNRIDARQAGADARLRFLASGENVSR